MAFAERFAFVFAVKGGGTFTQNIHPSLMERLAATSDATTGAGHYLDNMIRRLSAFYFFNQFTGITETVGDTYLHGNAVKVNRSATDTFQSAQFLKLDSFERLLRIQFISRTAGGFYNSPVVPKITPAPVDSPRGWSKLLSGSSLKFILA